MSDTHPKLHIRAMEPEDLDFLYEMENDRDCWGVSNTSVPYSRYVLHEYIASATNDIYADRQVRLVVDNDEKNVVGVVDLVDFNPQHRRAEVSIAVRKEFRRKGYAVSAMHLIMEYAVKILHLRQLYAIVSDDNEASLALFRSLGFADGNRLKDWLYNGVEYKDAILMQRFL